jgi:hypothetical protein
MGWTVICDGLRKWLVVGGSGAAVGGRGGGGEERDVAVGESGGKDDEQGKLEESESLCQQYLEVTQKVLRSGHAGFDEQYLASLLEAQGKLAEAELFFQQCLEVQKKVLGKHHPIPAVILMKMTGVTTRIKSAKLSSISSPHSLPESHPWIKNINKVL